MTQLMRCPYCGLLQDEPAGAKSCSRCGGGLEFEHQLPAGTPASYMQVQMELDQVAAPSGRNLERHLLLTLCAPASLPPGEASAGVQRPPLNFTAILDVSGSMRGEKLQQAKDAVRQAVRLLHAGDAFSLVTFASEVACPFEPVTVDQQVAAAVESALQEITAGGNTALCGGLERGIEKALSRKQEINLVLLLSDGQANAGTIDLEKIGEHALHAREKGLLVSTLGVGLDYNEALMAEIAIQGGGRYYHVQDAGRIPIFVAGELGEAGALAARGVQVRLGLPAGSTLVPLSAAYPVRQEGQNAIVSVGDIPCETELEIPLRLAILAQPEGSRLSLEGTMEFESPAGHHLTLPVNRVTVRFVKPDQFQLREGIVMPVAEKVFDKMKAGSILGISRVRAARPEEAGKRADELLESLRLYAELLGKERSEAEVGEMRDTFNFMAASPMQAKLSADRAYRSVRSKKDFDKK